MRIALLTIPIALAACATTAPTAPTAPTSTLAPPTLSGAWQTECFAVHNADDTDGSARIVHGFTDSLWSTDTSLFADVACADPTATLHVDGGYVLEAPSTSMTGAWNLRLDVRTRTITPHVDGFIFFLEAMQCGEGYGVGRASDAFEITCPAFGWPAVTTCSTERDVVLVDGSSLWRGERTADNGSCQAATRPTAFGAASKRM